VTEKEQNLLELIRIGISLLADNQSPDINPNAKGA
jgi:hypothetical protein